MQPLSAEANTHRSWIFQANPKYYNIREAVKHLKRIRWSVKQHKDEIHTGDKAFIWVCGDNAGVIARGKILSDPAEMEKLPEEQVFDTKDSAPSMGLRVDIEVEEVFETPVLRSDLQNDPVFRSMSILKVPNSTNFALTDQEAAALEEKCKNSDFGDDSQTLSSAFAKFHNDPVEQLRVHIRRKRAKQLRKLLANVDAIDLDTFNRDVWAFESSTRLDGEDLKNKLFSPQFFDEEFRERIRHALDNGILELHGNYIWGSGAAIFGPALKITNEERLQNVREALHIVNDATLPPVEKVKQICSIAGFGHNIATGLVMVYHPGEFAIWNKQSKEALKKLGYDANDLSSFQAYTRTLCEDLGADDFLELDWFLYLINQDSIQIGAKGTSKTKSSVRYWAMGLGPGGRL